tara:strand:+ start:386 stop:712 length:327 start_codon:yes stop_codon:yes gene_type:complete
LFLKIVLNLKAKKIILNNKFFQIFIFSILLFEYLNFKVLSEENYLSKELEINQTTKLEGEKSLDLPSNPFELVEMIRRANSMNDATKPSDAIDEAIKSFDMINSKESL